MICIGIDPGLKGGVAILDEGELSDAWPLPVIAGIVDAQTLHRRLAGLHGAIVTLEHAQAMPKQGVSSTFSYGVGFGLVRAALLIAGLRCELVRPTEWKRVVLSGTAKDKDAAVAWCRRAFPHTDLILPGCRKPHDGIADAICLAEYGRRTFAREAA